MSNTWIKSESEVFARIKKWNGFLSNMNYHYPVEYQGKIWRSTEHLYQAMKFSDPLVVNSIRNTVNPLEAKQVAYSYTTGFQNNYDTMDFKIATMLDCLILKTRQHLDVREKLIEIGNKPIVEYSKNDQFWGATPLNNDILVGENILGVCWTGIQSMVQDGTLNDHYVRSRFDFLQKEEIDILI